MFRSIVQISLLGVPRDQIATTSGSNSWLNLLNYINIMQLTFESVGMVK